MSLAKLLRSIHARQADQGIITADRWLIDLTQCVGGRCPAEILEGVTKRQWNAWLKAASQKLTYQRGEIGLLAKAADGNALPPHTIATFPCVITTTTQDRDGDILESKGAAPDPLMPLLWQHIPDMPIGRALGKQKVQSNKVTGRFTIANTALGQDAALLAEHGALRISHGFLPTKWEPLEDGEGFHILEFKILETSLVSVPSNPDAVIQSFSREKLAHPLVKAWAGAKFKERPNVVPVGIDLKTPPEEAAPCTCHLKKVVPYSATKKADQDKPWDADSAVKRLRSWAGVDADEPTDAAWKKYAKGFARVNGDGTKFGDFQLPHHDVDGGELVVVWKGVVAARAAAKGARGGMDLGDDEAGVIAHLDKHYKQFGETPPDEGKSAEIKGVYVEFENSWDDIRCDLSDSLLSFLMTAGVADYDDLAYIVDMFPEKAIVCVCEGVNRFYGPFDTGPISYDDDRCHYFACTWSMNGEEPQWTGTPEEVEITPNIQPAAERALRDMSTTQKAFLKDSHVKKLAKAMDHLEGARDHDDATTATKGLATKAHAAIKAVHDAHEKGILTGAHRKKLEKAMGYCSEGAEHEDATAPITKAFKAAHACVKDVMDSAGDMGEAAAQSVETPAAAPKAADDDVDAIVAELTAKGLTITAKGINVGPAEVRKAKSALHHLKAVEHHDDAANEHVELSRKATEPLQDMIDQVDSDPGWDDYNTGRADNPNEGKDFKGINIGVSQVRKAQTAMEHADAISKHKTATPHIKSMAKHAAAHLKAIVKPADPAGEAGENGAEGTEGENGNPPKNAEVVEKSFTERCDEMLDEAERVRLDDDASSLVSLAAIGSRAGKLAQKHFQRQAETSKQ